MKHIAIDLGGRESQICVRSEGGEILEERRHATARLGNFLLEREPSTVILETSCEAFAVADLARRGGHDVRVVPATLVRALGVGKRGTKTDVLDARVLSEASCRLELPSVHVPSMRSREVKAACTSREQLLGCERRWCAE